MKRQLLFISLFVLFQLLASVASANPRFVPNQERKPFFGATKPFTAFNSAYNTENILFANLAIQMDIALFDTSRDGNFLTHLSLHKTATSTLFTSTVTNANLNKNDINIYANASLSDLFHSAQNRSGFTKRKTNSLIVNGESSQIVLKISVATVAIISGVIAKTIKSNFDKKLTEFNELDKTLLFNNPSDLTNWNNAYAELQDAKKTGLLNAMVATSALSLGFEIFLLLHSNQDDGSYSYQGGSLQPSQNSLGIAYVYKF